MGTWGEDAFDNDTAADWAWRLEEVDDLSIIESTIDAALEGEVGFLDADVAVEALAACEVIARLKGNWGKKTSYSEAADTWVANHPLKPSAELIQRCEKAIDRVRSDGSELRELWNDSGAETWLASVEDLRSRILT